MRPLIAGGDEDTPPSSVSRDHKIWEDPSGLISAAGGKLTTHRAMGESLVDRALARLPAPRRRAAGPSRTARLPLREEGFDVAALEASLCRRFGLGTGQAEHLVRAYGCEAPSLLEAAPAEQHGPIGDSRFTWAEIPWSVRTECPATLCDLLEHRVRLALFARGQGLDQLDGLARLAGEAAGWDAARTAEEARRYRETVERRYRVSTPTGSRASAA